MKEIGAKEKLPAVGNVEKENVKSRINGGNLFTRGSASFPLFKR